MKTSIRLLAASLTAAVLLSWPSAPRAQAVPAVDRRITYILPQWFAFLSATPEEVAAEAADLRARIGEAPRVKVGFSTYITIYMSPVDPSDTAAVDAALSSTFQQMDAAVLRGTTAGIPIGLSFVTAIRGVYDPAQTAAEAADRRTMQWHADNSLAPGWTTLSRYSRKEVVLEEAYVREVGRKLAALMLANPDTVVAASGDGEVELSFVRSKEIDPCRSDATCTLSVADYSPFAIAEFRDWLTQGGLYAPGQPFAGEAWASSTRYNGDLTPGTDDNHDGHTLNGDYGTGFTSWDLLYFNWSLSDPLSPDPNAIPASTYTQPGWNPMPAGTDGGFDAPRMDQRGTPWWNLWTAFRQTMVWRHNLAFAKWMTTSVDTASGTTVPADRWFTDQIPADYLFNSTPDNPTERLLTSASPFWTADVSPYGSLGITSFNILYTTFFARTLAGVAPHIADRHVRWGIFEWNPCAAAAPASCTDYADYTQEIALVAQYRPSVLMPFSWKDPRGAVIEGTLFETMLRDLVTEIGTLPLTLSQSTVYANTTTDGLLRSPAQTVRVSGAPGETPAWSITAAATFLDVAKSADGRSFTVALREQPYNIGPLSGTVTIASSDPGYRPATLTVAVTASGPGTTRPPQGSFDTPADNATVSGEVGITGWAVDDVGVAGIDIYRSPLAGESTQANGLVFLGSAALVEGARPDVQAAYATTPLSSAAGWGYMLLTNMLPNHGDGVFTLWAVARDVDGHTTTLGSRRINGTNGSSLAPFGTIDTPLQGATVSGTIVNFGWALTPQPKTIPIDGSTISVVIDGVIVGHPTYNQPRADIAGLFPGYQNSGGPVAYYYIDTTKLANGVHTIAWLVIDSGGAATGMGSRYFTVANP